MNGTKKFSKSIEAFKKFSRPHTIWAALLAIITNAMLSSRNIYSVKKFCVICGIMFMATIYSVGINQLYDVEIDKINKSYLPLASKEYSMAYGSFLVALNLFLSLGLSLAYLDTINVMLFVVGILISTIYSVPYFKVRNYPVLTSLLISINRGVIMNTIIYRFYNGTIDDKYVRFIINSVVMIYIIGVYKDVPDVEGDTQHSRESFASKYGQTRTANMCVGALLLRFVVNAVLVGNKFGMLQNAMAFLTTGVIYMTKSDHTQFYMFIWKLYYMSLVEPHFDSAHFLRIIGTVAGLAGAHSMRKVDYQNRHYTDASSIQAQYNDWTSEGILEYYWGAHIHHGYYDNKQRHAMPNSDFKSAKIRLLHELTDKMKLQPDQSMHILDLGCGIGGSTRWLADKYKCKVTGITLSNKQRNRAQELTTNPLVNYIVMDATQMDFPDNTFDVVWSCESGEHMPDKKKFVDEINRVLKPAGTVMIATWCINGHDNWLTRSIYRQWALPYFVPIDYYSRNLTADKYTVDVHDWSKETQHTWLHQIATAIKDPVFIQLILNSKHPRKAIYRTITDVWAVLLMYVGFRLGKVRYGVIVGKKSA